MASKKKSKNDKSEPCHVRDKRTEIRYDYIEL